MARAWMGIALLALAACTPERPPAETALISKFTPLTTQEEFVAKVVGKPWKQTGISVHFLRDGTLGGMVGREPLSGTWTWKDGQLCALYRASDAGGGWLCQGRAAAGRDADGSAQRDRGADGLSGGLAAFTNP